MRTNVNGRRDHGQTDRSAHAHELVGVVAAEVVVFVVELSVQQLLAVTAAGHTVRCADGVRGQMCGRGCACASARVWLVGALERWCVCRGDQPIKINVVVKVGKGDQYIGGPPRF